MPKKANKLKRHSLHLRDGDMEFIQSMTPRGKANEFIRKLVSRTVDKLRANESRAEVDTSDWQV